ncbi:oxidoreductase [Marinibacterium profundimaris]|uniref:Oxidoreductase n=1 Tax=Marinibacterium profundimaris TaxID=1679460 RepID=A0A225NHE8_9RHOB|nr:oxidoreductase [Marinibacterium profundimaris]OWU72284.1 oxidoreductase [Marinibacterium profundimaris]
MRCLRSLAGATIGALLAALPALADELPVPDGPVILTVSGEIAKANVGDTVQMDLEMLRALGAREIETTTIWTEDMQSFVGVSLSTLMEAVGAAPVTIHATAINDYAVDIPHEDWSSGGPMLAYYRNGGPMKVRDKGPLWVVYPFDEDPMYRSEVIYSRSIWQLDRIIVGD